MLYKNLPSIIPYKKNYFLLNIFFFPQNNKKKGWKSLPFSGVSLSMRLLAQEIPSNIKICMISDIADRLERAESRNK